MRRSRERRADIAYASSKEVENDLIKSQGLGVLERSVCEDLLRQSDEVSRLCFGLSRIRTRRDDDPWPAEQEV
jgi:hypothetical protein